jgi:hypothetical protein
MSQNNQSFSGCLSDACLKHPPRCRSLNHMVNAADMIGCRPLIDHHMYMPMVLVSMKQPRGFDEEKRLAITQH